MSWNKILKWALPIRWCWKEICRESLSLGAIITREMATELCGSVAQLRSSRCRFHIQLRSQLFMLYMCSLYLKDTDCTETSQNTKIWHPFYGAWGGCKDLKMIKNKQQQKHTTYSYLPSDHENSTVQSDLLAQCKSEAKLFCCSHRFQFLRHHL